MGIDDLLQDLLQLLLAYVEVYLQLQEVLGIASVYESQILRQDLIEDETSQSGAPLLAQWSFPCQSE